MNGNKAEGLGISKGYTHTLRKNTKRSHRGTSGDNNKIKWKINTGNTSKVNNNVY